MDSPIFGSSSKNKHMFKANNNQKIVNSNPNSNSVLDVRYCQQVIVMLWLQKNMRRMIKNINRVVINKKRDIFNRIKQQNNEYDVLRSLSSAEEVVMLQVQRKMNMLCNVLKMGVHRGKLKGWRAMLQLGCGNSSSMRNGHRSNTNNNNSGEVVDNNRGETRIISQKGNNNSTHNHIKRVQDWKQNSASNVGDLPSENKRLKSQIQRQHTEEESFITKMKALLDLHEKPRGGPAKRKK